MFRKGISRFTSRYADYIVTLTERDTKNYRMRREQILITVGRLTHVKGIDMLAELAPKVLSRHEYCKTLREAFSKNTGKVQDKFAPACIFGQWEILLQQLSALSDE